MNNSKTLKDLRRARGLTLEAVGKIVGVGKSTVRKWENGDIQNMRRDKIALYANALGVHPSYLVGYSDAHDVEIYDISEAEPPKQLIMNEQRAHPVPISVPNYDAAATKAAWVLNYHKISACPVDPLAILKNTQGVFVCTFTEMASESGGLDSMVAEFGAGSQDAITYGLGDIRVVAFNQRLPHYMVQVALARELGHIALGHTDSIQSEVRKEEALVFARHLLCPRPLIKALTDSGVTLSVESVGNMTGCYGRTLAGIRETVGTNVPANLNRKIRGHFSEYIDMIVKCKSALLSGDTSGVADFGTYMDGYEE